MEIEGYLAEDTLYIYSSKSDQALSAQNLKFVVMTSEQGLYSKAYGVLGLAPPSEGETNRSFLSNVYAHGLIEAETFVLQFAPYRGLLGVTSNITFGYVPDDVKEIRDGSDTMIDMSISD